MPVAINIWRARIGHFNSNHNLQKTCKKSQNRLCLKWILDLLFMISGDQILTFVTNNVLLLILLSHITFEFVANYAKTRSGSTSRSKIRILFLYFELIFLVPFLSLIVRALLIQGGSVEENPGPHPNYCPLLPGI